MPGGQCSFSIGLWEHGLPEGVALRTRIVLISLREMFLTRSVRSTLGSAEKMRLSDRTPTRVGRGPPDPVHTTDRRSPCHLRRKPAVERFGGALRPAPNERRICQMTGGSIKRSEKRRKMYQGYKS